LELSSASVSALFTKQPSQVKLSTLIALCTALGCTPDDPFDVDTTPVAQPISPKPMTAAVNDAQGSRRGRGAFTKGNLLRIACSSHTLSI
jgi:putative transcriptional regulator